MRRASPLLCRAVRLIECPRDAMQGLKNFVPTTEKIRFINSLLQVGFHTVDCGSFVPAPAVPQMRDTAEVIAGLDMTGTKSKLLVVVCNKKGARLAVEEPRVTYVGYPLSACETFQRKNTNRDIATALDDLEEIQKICRAGSKELVVYISMGFGNPYGEPFSVSIVEQLVDRVAKLGIKIISVADTVGVSEPGVIHDVYGALVPKYADVEFGAHFHSGAVSTADKLKAALDAGCLRFDGALGGMGGCPFAKSTLVGNVATEAIVDTLGSLGISHGLDTAALEVSSKIKDEVFGVGVKELVLASVLHDERFFLDMCLKHFSAVDDKQVGYLTREQFVQSLASAYQDLGEDAPSEVELSRKFDRMDLTNDGRITFDEYMVGVRRGLKKRLEGETE